MEYGDKMEYTIIISYDSIEHEYNVLQKGDFTPRLSMEQLNKIAKIIGWIN